MFLIDKERVLERLDTLIRVLQVAIKHNKPTLARDYARETARVGRLLLLGR